jgi:adenine deaminase
MDAFTLSANLVDVPGRRIVPGTLTVTGGRVADVRPEPGTRYDGFLLPGFIDAHVHVESSMMVPSEFARFAVTHGTVATVSDPHEIANVLGLDGVRLMVANGSTVPFKFHWGAPPCVPATRFETSGATLTAADVCDLFDRDGLRYLSEVMNFPGVLAGDPDMTAKIEAAKSRGLPVDGHAPGLRGDAARRYAAAGITTDHECVTLDEALDKLAYGMTVIIREGSAARNLAALHPLLKTHRGRCMLGSDDLHPDALEHGHVNRLVRRCVAGGHDLFDVLEAACVVPVRHYGLPVGLLRVGDPADFIVTDDLTEFRVRATYLDGRKVAEDGRALFDRGDARAANRFAVGPLSAEAFRLPSRGGLVRVIEARDGQLVTSEMHLPAPERDGELVSDVARDILALAVVNRYADAPPGLGFVHGFGLKRGAIAASVAHDSHNVVAVGTSARELCAAVNAVVAARGGLAVADGERVETLPLEVAGLMGRDGVAVAAGYAKLDALARRLGSPLAAPFMTLSFMALLVIPALKLSDRGLFDGTRFEFTSLYV